MKLYPYNPASESAKALAQALDIKRIKHEGKPLKVKGGVINWGASQFKREVIADVFINLPEFVAVAGNKLQTFKHLDGYVPIPKWTESLEEANKWLAEGVTVVARTTVTGHSGEGIVIAEKVGDALPKAPLYTQYVPKKDEYRIHVVAGKAIFVQRKARKKDVPDEQVNWKVRNHGNGFIFAHEGVDAPDVAKRAAIMAVDMLSLDFGAVDIIYNQKHDKWFVLEVNTAPGLEGTTLDKYVEAFKELM